MGSAALVICNCGPRGGLTPDTNSKDSSLLARNAIATIIKSDNDARSDRLNLAHDTEGSGHPVVFIHAGIADRGMWAAQVRVFAERFLTVTYDMRGFGESEMVDKEFSHPADLATLLDALRIDRAHLVGCSMGGGAALQFAVEYPGRVTGLVLVNANAPGFTPEGGYFEPPQWKEAVAAFERGDLDRSAELEIDIWLTGMYRSPGDVDEGIRVRVLEMNRRAARTEERRDQHEHYLAPTAGLRLDEIECPTLVVLGDLDVPDMRPTAEHLVAGIDGARLATITAAAHLPNLERPDHFNDVVLGFLSEI